MKQKNGNVRSHDEYRTAGGCTISIDIIGYSPYMMACAVHVPWVVLYSWKCDTFQIVCLHQRQTQRIVGIGCFIPPRPRVLAMVVVVVEE